MQSFPTGMASVHSATTPSALRHTPRSGQFQFTPNGIQKAASLLASQQPPSFMRLLEDANQDCMAKANAFVKKDDTLSRLVFNKSQVLPPWNAEHFAPVSLLQQGIRQYLSLNPYFGQDVRPAFKETLGNTVLLPEKAKTLLEVMNYLKISSTIATRKNTSRRSPVLSKVQSTYHPFNETVAKHPLEVTYTIGQTVPEANANKASARLYLTHWLQFRGFTEGTKNDFIIKR